MSASNTRGTAALATLRGHTNVAGREALQPDLKGFAPASNSLSVTSGVSVTSSCSCSTYYNSSSTSSSTSNGAVTSCSQLSLSPTVPAL